jgi:hypothetical protein
MVKNNRQDKFDELYLPYLDQSKIEALYLSIKRGLTKGPNEKKSPPPKPLIYKYPMIKGFSIFPVIVEKASKMEKVSKMVKVEKVKRVIDAKAPRTSRKKYVIPSTEYPLSANNPLGGGKSKRTTKKRATRIKTKKSKRKAGKKRKTQRTKKKVRKIK